MKIGFQVVQHSSEGACNSDFQINRQNLGTFLVKWNNQQFLMMKYVRLITNKQENIDKKLFLQETQILNGL